MNIEVKSNLPFDYCERCRAISARLDTITCDREPYFILYSCENAEICQRADKARREEEKHGREEK